LKSLKVLGDGKDLQLDAVIMGAAKEETGK
jgi:hypothetical protein